MKSKITAIILLTAMLVTVLISCSNEKVNKPVIAKVDHVYRSDFINLPEDYNLSSESVSFVNERINVLCYKILNEETWETQNILYSVDINGENPKSDIITIENENASISNYILNADGSAIILENYYDQNNNSNMYNLIKKSSDGSIVYKIDPVSMFPVVNDERYGSNGGIYVNNAIADKEGNIYLASNNSVLVVSPNGEKLFDIVFQNHLRRVEDTADGKVFVSYYDGGNFTYKYIDIAKKGLGSDIELPKDIFSSNSNIEIYIGTGYDAYINDGTTLSGYNNGNTATTVLVNWINSDIDQNRINTLKILSPDKFVYMGYDELTSKKQIIVLSKASDDEITEKYIINLACIYSDYMLTSYIIKFNRTNDKYRIILNDYNKYNTNENRELGLMTLNNEIAAGKIPDIFILSDNSMPIESYIQKELFCDLNELMEKDTEFNRDNLLKCVTVPFEKNGKLYQLITSFTLSTIAGKTSVVGDGEGWTIDDLMNLIEKSDEKTLMKYTTQSSLVSIICTATLNEFIDYETGKCSFDDGRFAKILEYAKTLDTEYDYSEENENTDRYKPYRDGDILLDTLYISGYEEYLKAKIVFGDEPINLIGFPVKSGNGVIINAGSSYAISEKSACKDGAWKFLKFCISDEVQSSNMSMSGFPVTTTALDKLAKEQMSMYYFFYYDGGWGSSSEPFDAGDNGNNGKPGRVTQEDVDLINNYINSATMTASYDSKLLKMITEETSMYFAGEKSLDETIKVIQNRISIYISESN